MLTEAELERRKPVWVALSELFLDTNSTLAEESIVQQLAASPYDLATLERILEREVAPVCIWNRFWWAWSGFQEEWLAQYIIRTLSRPSLVRWLPLPGKHGFGPPGYWQKLKRRIQAYRDATG
jgi:hypothetical protein